MQYEEMRAKYALWFEERLKSVSYKPGFTFHFDRRHYVVSIHYDVPCSDNPKITTKLHYGRAVEPMLIEDVIPTFNYWIRHFLMTFETHELDEWLRVDGDRLNNPHANDLAFSNTFEGGCG